MRAVEIVYLAVMNLTNSGYLSANDPRYVINGF